MIRIILLIIVVILLLITFFKKTLENFGFNPLDAGGGSGGVDPCGLQCNDISFENLNNNDFRNCVCTGRDFEIINDFGIKKYNCLGVISDNEMNKRVCRKVCEESFCPLVLTDDDKKMLDNVIDNSVNVDTLNETQDNKSRLNKVLNMAEELSEKVPKLINRFKETQQREKVSENRI